MPNEPGIENLYPFISKNFYIASSFYNENICYKLDAIKTQIDKLFW